MAGSERNDVRQLAAELQELNGRLSRLEARQEIADRLQRYSRGLDRHDSDLLASVFHEDAEMRYGPDTFPDGPATFVPWANALHERTWTNHVHLSAINSVDIDGDVAHAETYVFFSLRRKDEPRIDIGAGRYVDRIERRDGEWRIAVREMLLDWQATVDAAPEVPQHHWGSWDRSDPSYLRPLEIHLDERGREPERG